MSTQLYLIVVVSMFTMLHTANQCKQVHSVSEHILQGHVIRAFTQNSFGSCVIKCEEEPNCFSINYLFPTTICQLNNATAERHPRDFVTWPDAVYIGSLVRDDIAVIANPCDERVPPCGGFCAATPGSLVSTCVCLYHDSSACQSDACKPQALGIENGTIKIDQLTASATHFLSSLSEARLNSNGAWTPTTDNEDQWLQVSFGSQTKIVTKIALQGHRSKWYWTKAYKIEYKQGASAMVYYLDQTNNTTKIFTGNSAKGDAVVYNSFTPPIIANVIRIRPVTYYGRIAIRLELYGCHLLQ